MVECLTQIGRNPAPLTARFPDPSAVRAAREDVVGTGTASLPNNAPFTTFGAAAFAVRCLGGSLCKHNLSRKAEVPCTVKDLSSRASWQDVRRMKRQRHTTPSLSQYPRHYADVKGSGVQ